jgi:hypothetical protein
MKKMASLMIEVLITRWFAAMAEARRVVPKADHDSLQALSQHQGYGYARAL